MQVSFPQDVETDAGGVDTTLISKWGAVRTGRAAKANAYPLYRGTGDVKKTRPGSSGYLSRNPRVAVRYDAVLIEADGCELEVVITDVSRDGFRLESNAELEVGAEVRIRVGKREPVGALIRWTRGLEAGGVFLEPVAL